MDWSELERKPDISLNQHNPSFSIPVKKVAVLKNQIRRLPDGTTIVLTDEPTYSQKRKL